MCTAMVRERLSGLCLMRFDGGQSEITTIICWPEKGDAYTAMIRECLSGL